MNAPTAGQRPTYPKYSYDVQHVSAFSALAMTLDSMGADGWRLVHVMPSANGGYVLFMERPVLPPEKAKVQPQ